MTQDDIIRMARERDNLLLQTIRRYFPHIPSNDDDIWSVFLNFANAVYAAGAAAEREACAKVCDAYDVAEDVNNCDTAEGMALAIRARGAK